MFPLRRCVSEKCDLFELFVISGSTLYCCDALGSFVAGAWEVPDPATLGGRLRAAESVCDVIPDKVKGIEEVHSTVGPFVAMACRWRLLPVLRRLEATLRRSLDRVSTALQQERLTSSSRGVGTRATRKEEQLLSQLDGRIRELLHAIHTTVRSPT